MLCVVHWIQAVNAYYACFLYGTSTEDSKLVQFSRLLLSMEVISAKKYWHMPDSSIYDQAVAESSRMIGVWLASTVCIRASRHIYLDERV